jgi:hypothetical protein
MHPYQHFCTGPSPLLLLNVSAPQYPNVHNRQNSSILDLQRRPLIRTYPHVPFIKNGARDCMSVVLLSRYTPGAFLRTLLLNSTRAMSPGMLNVWVFKRDHKCDSLHYYVDTREIFLARDCGAIKNAGLWGNSNAEKDPV